MPSAAGMDSKITKLSKFVLRQSTVLNLLICTTAFSFLAWQISSLQFDAIKSLTDLPLLDARWSYTHKDVDRLMHQLGQEGRNLYLRLNLYDFAFVPTLTAILAMAIGVLFHRSGLPHEWNLFPSSYMVLDLAENVFIRYLLTTFPGFPSAVADVAGDLTRYKYRFFFYSLAIVGFGLLAVTRKMLQHWWRNRTASSHRD